MTRNDRCDMQSTLHSTFPCSLQMEMENRPKLARIRLIWVPGSHAISSDEPSHAYKVRYRGRGEPGAEAIAFDDATADDDDDDELDD